ncbi:hypothetical protein [Cupriavidus taiwanensis]|uniref:Uncharacterized protein n=1 Tax=Cupriavidus taiwanensis (strain DSM 17343 / BCRC 17206 / CCUG 44338 / CIP 107171 / LMG 19424 / R1) TaxID=977880 RepID=B3R9K3_CUPTR|nr:hypothetical protein [Cupriavidus taiwanensis]CAQ71578.1 hypothetical protein RALTA_B0967 [Cupriavidus taiwanensis LMG 19424]
MSELAQAINAAVAEELGLTVEPIDGAEGLPEGAFGDPLPEPEVKHPVPPMEPEKLKELARAYLRGEIFTDRQCQQPNDLHLAFMPIVFGALSAFDVGTLGLIYEFWSEAGPRSINGMPTFFSMRMLNREDATTLAGYVEKLAEAEKNALAALG